MRTAPREGGAEVGYVDIDWPIERNRFRHPPQLDPWHPIGQIAAEVVADMRFRRQVLRLHRLGPRVTGEVLAHLGAKHGIQTSVEQTVEHFAGLDAAALAAAGAGDFWPLPLHEVKDGDDES